MQCYNYLAAVTAVANRLDELPGVRHRMPYSVVAEWMSQYDIEPEELLCCSGDEVRALVEEMIHQHRPEMPNAA